MRSADRVRFRRVFLAACFLLLPGLLWAQPARERFTRREILLRAARNQANARNFKGALAYYREYLEAWPDDYPVSSEYGGVLIQATKVDEAITVLTAAAEKMPKEMAAVILLADAYMMKKDFAKAADLLAKAVAGTPKDKALRRKLGEVYAWAQRYEEAIREYRVLQVENPDDLAVQKRILEIMSWAKMTEPYLSESQKLLERHPLEMSVRLARVDLYTMKKDFAKAAAECHELLKIEPRHPIGRARLAQLLGWLGDYERAMKEYPAALALNPEDTGLLREYGRLLMWRRRFSDAVTVYRKLIAELPGDENVVREYLEVAGAARPVPEVERKWIREYHRTHFIEKKSLQPATVAALAAALAATGADEEALVAFEAALKALPKDVGLRLQYADLLQKVGRAEDAEEQYKVLLERFKEPQP